MVSIQKKTSVVSRSKINPVLTTLIVVASYLLVFIIFNNNNNIDVDTSTPRYPVYFTEQEFISTIQISLEELGVYFSVIESEERLQVEVTVDSTGGLVVAKAILVNLENDTKIVFVDRSPYVFSDTRGHITSILRQVFEDQHDVIVAGVFFNSQRWAWDLSEREVYKEELEQNISQQIQDFIEQMQE